MSDDINDVKELELLLLKRASVVANDYLQHAQQEQDQLLANAKEHLQLHEEHELAKAKKQASIRYRMLIQSSELSFQKKLDQLRWQLSSDVIQSAKQNLIDMMEQKTSYQKLILLFLREALERVDTDRLVVEFNQKDYQQLKPEWTSLIGQLETKKKVELSSNFHFMSGGMIIYNHNQNIRLDQTIEGRLKRYSEQLNCSIAQCLFSELSHESEKIHVR